MSKSDDKSSTHAIDVRALGARLSVSDATVEAASRFLASAIGEPGQNVVGLMGGDWLRIRRIENALLMAQRAQQRLRARGITNAERVLPLKLAHPLIEAASLEEDPAMRDRWANLLCSSLTSADADLHRSFVEVLRTLTPIQAQILDQVYSLPFDEALPNGVFASDLPERATIVREGDSTDNPPPPRASVKVAISALVRFNLLRPQLTWNGSEHFGSVNVTEFGRAFVAAVSDRSPTPHTADIGGTT